MKVLHLVKTAVGAEWVYHQVQVLCSLGIQVVVALPSTTDGLAPFYQRAGATIVRVNVNFRAQHIWRVPTIVAACRNLVREVKPDLVHSHHVGTAFALRVALGKNSSVPHIFQVPGPLHLEHGAFAALDTWLAGPHDYWIATCQWTRRKYAELGVPPERVFLAYAGTDLEPFTGVRTARLRKELGISDEVPLIGMVSYMYAPVWFLGQRRGIKGHEDFMAALALARQIRPDIRGVIIGGPWGEATWYEERLRKLGAKTSNRSLNFCGHRRDVPAIYPDLDLAVVPSHSENCGGALEPLLSGIPVVATNVGGLPDLIEHGVTGWLVPPRNPEALAGAMLDALQNQEESRRRSIQGKERARNLFDIEKVGREVAAIYERVLSHSVRSIEVRVCPAVADG
jgi:glycosyltransferase involved in cell wall biosynthesis